MSNKLTACFIVLFILVCVNKTAYSLSTSNTKNKSTGTFQSLSDTIEALDITRKKYQNELLILNNSFQKSNNQDNILKNEYSIFINYLSFQINNYCTEIIQDHGEKSVKELPCSLNNNEVINSNNNEKYLTSDEKIETLDDEFMTALGEFDEMLLNEDEKIAQINKKNVNESNNNGKKGNLSGDVNEGADQQSEKDTKESKNNQSSKENSRSKGNNKQNQNNSYQRKKLDQIDDDIVARQLKEAAEKETNPELKEKLWNEYYKYKKTLGK